MSGRVGVGGGGGVGTAVAVGVIAAVGVSGNVGIGIVVRVIGVVGVVGVNVVVAVVTFVGRDCGAGTNGSEVSSRAGESCSVLVGGNVATGPFPFIPSSASKPGPSRQSRTTAAMMTSEIAPPAM